MINNTDIYNETSLVNDIKKKYCPDIPDESMLLSLLGHIGEIEARNLRNSLMVQSELSNEFFYTRCKKDNNIMLHAISNNITDIMATPAYANIILAIKESDINNMLVNNTAVIYNDSKLYIESFEYHLDYNIIITKSIISNEEVIYSARYDIDSINNISDITIPYLQAPVMMSYNNESYLFIYCMMRQTIITDIPKKIISNSALENKMVDFEFEDQLTTFYVSVTDEGVTTNITPILEGANINGIANFCNYSFIDDNMIRIVFNSDSYVPGLNATVNIKVVTTKGSSANLSYSKNTIQTLESEIGNYNISAILMIQTDPEGGKDKRSISEIQSILPKEALSKGTISIYKGLENKFNTFNSSKFKIKLEQRADNQVERSYFSYIAMKDKYNNIIPTNTITASIDETEFEDVDDGIYVIPQGSYIVVKDNVNTPKIYLNPTEEDLEGAEYIYTIPFMTVINYERNYVAFYSTLISQNKMIYFRDINSNCLLQYIATNVDWKREYMTDKNKYKLSVTLNQNIDYDYEMVETVEENDGISYDSKVRVIALLYASDGSAYRYIEGTLTNYDTGTYACTFDFELETNDDINSNNYIRINNLKEIGTNNVEYGYLPSNTNVDLFVLEKTDSNLGRFELDTYIPDLDEWSVCNVYKISKGLDFFINYTSNISSILSFTQIIVDDAPTTEEEVTDENTEGEVVDEENDNTEEEVVDEENDNTPQVITKEVFTIKSLPVVKRDYLQKGEEYMQDFISSLYEKKLFIDNIRNVLDNNFVIDMKFFNTYGYSKRFMIDSLNGTYLDKVNINPTFKLLSSPNADKTVPSKIKADIKNIIEDITPDNLPSIHFAKITGLMNTKYQDSIDYLQFNGFNIYGPETQYLERINSNDIFSVPELISIDESDDGSPAINII